MSLKVGAGSLALLVTMCVYIIYLSLQCFPTILAPIMDLTASDITSIEDRYDIPPRYVAYPLPCSLMKVLSSVFELIQVISQTRLLLLISSKHFVEAYMKIKMKQLLKTILMVLFVCNLFYWINSSFIEFKIVQNSVSYNLVYGPNIWSAVSTFVWPITLYYRYESAHTILEVLLDKLSKH